MFYFQTHSEAVRLDDYDELAKHKGNESDVFQWLTHQAWHGLSNAQVGYNRLQSSQVKLTPIDAINESIL